MVPFEETRRGVGEEGYENGGLREGRTGFGIEDGGGAGVAVGFAPEVGTGSVGRFVSVMPEI